MLANAVSVPGPECAQSANGISRSFSELAICYRNAKCAERSRLSRRLRRRSFCVHARTNSVLQCALSCRRSVRRELSRRWRAKTDSYSRWTRNRDTPATCALRSQGSSTCCLRYVGRDISCEFHGGRGTQEHRMRRVSLDYAWMKRRPCYECVARGVEVSPRFTISRYRPFPQV